MPEQPRLHTLDPTAHITAQPDLRLLRTGVALCAILTVGILTAPSSSLPGLHIPVATVTLHEPWQTLLTLELSHLCSGLGHPPAQPIRCPAFSSATPQWCQQQLVPSHYCSQGDCGIACSMLLTGTPFLTSVICGLGSCLFYYPGIYFQQGLCWNPYPLLGNTC